MSEGLSQDDFRRLLATPRPPINADELSQQQTKFKMPAPRTPRNTGAIFAQPRSMRKKNKKMFKKNDEEDDEEQQEKSNYRDRAAERRQQELGGEVDESQLTTEELLKRTQAEVDEELDPKQLYEQSKYLGGDVSHTHLVKGLDYALLKKVKSDLSKRQTSLREEEQNDDDMDEKLDQALDRFERGERIEEDDSTTPPQSDVPKFHTLMAKNIYQQIEQQIDPDQQPKIDLFQPGKMAFVFELADEVGHYSDAFAIPTAVMRSKTDVSSKLSKSGWSEESQAETSLVIEKISQVMARVRHSGHEQASTAKQEKKTSNVATASITSEPIAMMEDGFMGDIFADAGRDYELNEDKLPTTNSTKEKKEGSYFKGLLDEREDEDMHEANDDAVNALLKRAASSRNDTASIEEDVSLLSATEENAPKRRKQNNGIGIELDTDAADIDMFGLSSSALPTTFEEHHAVAYQSDDDDDNNNESSDKRASTQMIDQGTSRNKKAQLTRWDFDTEEEWQNYKDSIEIHPKSAFQFGVKLGDGRKRHRERKGLSDKQRLDREYQQVKNIMSQKYGKSLEK
ncbi:MAG: RED-like protein N-terminal region-domain-containing protein [Benjaminiella poitrasii]|nr:MAG: RED-like protein N-terminal region-domain-containing protein [Benjaminiella poitrasii]